MLKKLVITIGLIFFISCYGNNDLYSKNLDSLVPVVKKYDVDRIENNMVVLISKDLKEVKTIKKEVFKKSISEGDQVTYTNSQVFISENRKLKRRVNLLIEQLDHKNKVLSIKL